MRIAACQLALSCLDEAASHCKNEEAIDAGGEALVQNQVRSKSASVNVVVGANIGAKPRSDRLHYPFADVGTKASLFQLANPSDLRVSCRKATPSEGSMKGRNKLHAVLEEADRVSSTPGDIVEAGVAGGGGVLPVIFYLACTGDLAQRTVHLFDTWEGLNPTSSDAGFEQGAFKVGYDAFMANVEQYRNAYNQNTADIDGSLSWDEAWTHVNIVKGLFADTMPGALTGKSLSLLMCDGDMYSSTKDCLAAAADLVVSGGTIYNDDYYSFAGCYQAMHEYNLLPDNSTRHKVLLVPEWTEEFTYMEEDASSCTPPQSNSGQSQGKCNSVVAEAALIHVM